MSLRYIFSPLQSPDIQVQELLHQIRQYHRWPPRRIVLAISSLEDRLYTYNFLVNMQDNVPTSAPQCDVDPAGDLILLVGQGKDQKPIRVSSKVLSLASPVFATMFGPRYLEGHILSKQARFSTPSFRLPEEDPEAMTWFCRAIHLQLNADVATMNVGLILKLAALCDKYDTSTALSGWSRLEMEKISSSLLHIYNLPSRHPPTMVDFASYALYTSFTFKNHWTFWLATRNIVHHNSLKDMFAQKKMYRDSVLPNRLFGEYFI